MLLRASRGCRVGYAGAMARQRMGTTYRPLVDHLEAQPASPVTRTFAEIEAVLGRRLPRAAYTRTWWRSRTTALGQQLATAGWEVRAADERRGRITFGRVVDDGRRPDSTTYPLV